MCGIYVSVVDCSAEDAIVSGDSNTPPLWLERRGPDHQGYVVQKHNSMECKLYASVLSMRQRVEEQQEQQQQQPVPILYQENKRMAHFAWNGEVYQTIDPIDCRDTTIINNSNTNTNSCNNHNHDNEDDAVWSLHNQYDYNISDTRFMTEWIQQALDLSNQKDELMCMDTNNTDNNSNSNSCITVNIENNAIAVLATAQRIAQVLSRLVNAEFAFCLLTEHAVYYGKDIWGRRSLLVNNSKNNNSNNPTSMRWRLASVATDMELGWDEVPPGIVYAYDWTTTTTCSSENNNTIVVPWQPQTIPTPTLSFRATESSSTNTEQASYTLQHLLMEAVQRRLCLPPININNKNSAATNVTQHCTTNAVLFSGGLDSVVVAALALTVLPTEYPLTLVNISFVNQLTSDGDNKESIAADTLAAQASYHELQNLFPSHTIHLIQEQVDWETVSANEAHIRTLLHPKSITTMDLNIGTALWFAARSVSTHTRVLLTGLGADELLGGYGRHQSAWRSNGEVGWRQQLQLDQERLWDRNLGRDDRVLSDTAREMRLPFLDPTVVAFVRQLPMQCVVDYNQQSCGDKLILRRVAQRMGLHAAANATKRAIQFGSRVAQVSDRQRFGSRRKATGTAAAVTTTPTTTTFTTH